MAYFEDFPSMNFLKTMAQSKESKMFYVELFLQMNRFSMNLITKSIMLKMVKHLTF